MHEKLRFIFKGSRDYVHGTSLFDAVIEAAEQRGIGQGTVNITFRKIIRNPVCILEQRSAEPDDAVVAKLCGQGGEIVVLCINEALTIEPADRRQFDESDVCRGAVLGDKSIVQDNPHHSDRIELLVSLCKKMHQECIDSKKNWVFSRYDGQYPIPSPVRVELRITKQVGTRLTRSDVLIDERKIGDMYFS